MTLWNPIYRIKVNGYTVTDATLSGLTVTSGRSDIYSQPVAGYCNLTLIETNQSNVPYEINDPLTVEVQDSNGDWVSLFGGFISDLAITVQTSGSTAISQKINLIGVGALARLNRAIYNGNLAEDEDGNQIYYLLSQALFETWDEVPAGVTWNDYDAATTWATAGNSGLGDIDLPGDYLLEAQTNLNDDIYSLVADLANSALGYLYEDAQGQIGYADATRRTEYLETNGYIDLTGHHAFGEGLNIVKRTGDVRNSITIVYKATGNQSVTDSDSASINLYGELASTITTKLKNQADAEAQAAFYLALRAYPQYQMKQISFPVASPEIGNQDRDSLLNVFMGMPVNITQLPANMVNGEFQGFVEGWTWSAGYNRLNLTLNISPVAYSLQAFRWNTVPDTETWQTINANLIWLNATIVA